MITEAKVALVTDLDWGSNKYFVERMKMLFF